MLTIGNNKKANKSVMRIYNFRVVESIEMESQQQGSFEKVRSKAFNEDL